MHACLTILALCMNAATGISHRKLAGILPARSGVQHGSDLQLHAAKG
jgi:hypothetical protein